MYQDTKTAVQELNLQVVLSGIQATAVDLYQRRFNVMPLPSAHDWQAIFQADLRSGKKSPDDKPSKEPYIVRPFFTARLHYRQNCTCKLCANGADLVTLFERSNLAVMTGRTSGNLLAVDCDSQSAFGFIGKELTARGLPFWAITSHRGGAYLMRLIEGEAANIPNSKSKYQDVEIWGNRHFVVMPPSVHPLGTVYQWKSPEPRFCLPTGESIPPVSVKSLEWLGISLLVKERGAYSAPDFANLPEWTAVLSRRNRETLANGASDGERNTRLTAAAYDMAGNDIAYDVAMEALTYAAEKCTPVYAYRDTVSILKSAYKSDRTPARLNPPKVRDWQRAKEFADAYNWREAYKRRAIRAERMFAACIERARRDDNKIFRASARELAELANVNKETATDFLHCFTRDDLLVHKGNADDGTNLFAFPPSFPDTSKFRTLSLSCRCSVRNLEVLKLSNEAEHDVFSGLGEVARKVWYHLLITPEVNAYRTARAMNLPPSSVYAAFTRLRAVGLISYGSEGVYYGESRTEAEFESLSYDTGTHGKNAAKRAKHNSEREAYVNMQVMKAKAKYNVKIKALEGRE
ncbi:MAG: bifunctional DNA primase/polymerase [Anaerolineales bacterium]|nr:bifunctional DNA primase/polymerase [Anaerolineales bacterium]